MKASDTRATIVQVSRTMARLYKEEVGPWTAYMGVLGP